MRQRFRIFEVENVITDESAAGGDYASSEASDEIPADLYDALRVLDSDCWDNVDERDDSVILYPADYHQSMQTGDYSATEVIIRGAAKDIDHLMRAWERGRRGA